MPQAEKFDVLVIGAGIMGAACAFNLSQKGLKVAVLESQVSPALGSTGKSAAGVRVQYTQEVNIRISWESIQIYRDFPQLYGEESGYKPIGYLFLVPPDRWESHLEGARKQDNLGAPVKVLSVDEAQSLVRFDKTGLAGTTFGPADGIVDPHFITFAYLKMAKEKGVKVYLETPLLKAEQVGKGWRVETPRGTFEGEHLINATGSWAGEVAKRAGLEVPIHPVRRIIYLTAPTGWKHSFPLTIDLSSGFYLRSEGNRVLFGRSKLDEPPGFSEGLDWDWFETTITTGMERFPWLEETQLDRKACWWGYYEVTPDHDCIVGRMPGVNNWINVAGFSGHGVQQAPVMGRLMAEEILSGKAHTINIDPLRITRFSANQLNRESNIV